MDRQERLDFLHARKKLTDEGMVRAVAEAVVETVNGVAVATVATASDLSG